MIFETSKTKYNFIFSACLTNLKACIVSVAVPVDFSFTKENQCFGLKRPGEAQEARKHVQNNFCDPFSNKRSFRDPGGVGGLDSRCQAKICARELASVAFRGLRGPPAASRHHPPQPPTTTHHHHRQLSTTIHHQ